MVRVNIGTKSGYKIYVYADEHPPAHCHIYRGNSVIIVNLQDATIIKRSSMKPKEAKRALEEFEVYQERCKSLWNQLNPLFKIQ